MACYLHTYCSATAIVVEVHEGPSISYSSLFGIYEGFGKLYPIVNVITAATPVKLASRVASSSSFVRITVTYLQLPLAAGTS